MRVAKTIEELYAEAKGYDVVITNDAALATALNARVDVPRIGGFAYTAKQVAAMREGFTLGGPVMSDLDIVRAIMKDTDLDFRFIYSEVLNIRDIRKYRADVENYLYSSRARQVWNTYKLLRTRERSMSDYDYRQDAFFKGKKVAVIGLDFFNDLDKHMYSDDMEEIDIFKPGDYGIDTIYAVGNDRQVADGVVDLLKGRDPTDTAVVFDSEGPIADAVRAALYREEIPFKNNLDVRDLSQVRDFLHFVTLALSFDTLRISDVRELFAGYGARDGKNGNGLKTQYDKYLLRKAPLEEPVDSVTASLIAAMKGIRGMTYGQALDAIVGDRKYLRHLKPSIEILLRDVGAYDETVTPERTGEIVYAVNNVEDLRHNEQIPEEEKQGVLLVDSKNSIYVDRPLVVFVGMDGSWEKSTAGKDYVDAVEEAEKNSLRTSVLLQQGDCRVYVVKPMTDGKPTQPCQQIMDMYSGEYGGERKPIDGFRDICREYKLGSWHIEEERAFSPSGTLGFPDSDEHDRSFSKTRYNQFAECPLAYLFGYILKTEENDHLVFGDCLHDFAELYFCYPELVKKNGTDRYLGMMDSLYSGLSSDCMEEIDHCKFKIYLNNLMKYIDSIRPADVPLDRKLGTDEKNRNRFMEMEGLELRSSMAETSLDCNFHMFAKFDCCIGPSISDYKTGKSKGAAEIKNGFDRESDDHCEFQPLIYLAVLKSEKGYGRASFNLFFIGENDIESTGENFDIRRNIHTVKLVPGTHDCLVLSDESPVRYFCAASRNYKKINANWDDIVTVLKEYGGSDVWSGSPEVKQRIVDITGLADSSVERVLNMMCSPYVIDGDGTVNIASDSMDEFIRQVGVDFTKASKYKSDPFYEVPTGNLNCDRCNFRNACMAVENKMDTSGEGKE